MIYNNTRLRISTICLSLLMIALGACSSFENENLETNEDAKAFLTDPESIQGQRYFWYKGKKLYLEYDPQKKYIVYDAADEKTILGRFHDAIVSQGKVSFPQSLVLTGSEPLHETDLRWAVLHLKDGLDKADDFSERILYQGDFFKTEQGLSIGLSQLVYVKLKSEADLKILQDTLKTTKVIVLGFNKFMPKWYTLDCTYETRFNSLETANRIFESGCVEEAQPDIITDNNLILASLFTAEPGSCFVMQN